MQNNSAYALANNIQKQGNQKACDITAEFAVSVNEGCTPLTVNFTNLSTGVDIVHYYWIFGDGTSSMDENPVKVYNNPFDADEIYIVELIAANADFTCTDSFFADITVYQRIEAGFSINPVNACAPYEAEIHNTAINAEHYLWVFGDGSPDSTSDAPIIPHTYDNPDPGNLYHTIEQTVWLLRGGEQVCHKEFEKDITIFPEVTAALTADIIEGCAPLTVEFQNNSINETFVYWDFDDGSTSSQENPVHAFQNTTDATIEYEVMLVAWSDESCYDTTYVTIDVHPQVTAGFDFSPAEICQYQEVEFTNTSASGSGMTYAWDFGPDAVPVDGDPLNDPTFTYRFDHGEPLPQKYEIELIVTTAEGCEAVAIDSITVYPIVIADFVPVPVLGCSPLEVSFDNNSTGGFIYRWDFDDDDASSTDFEPTHIFANPGYVDTETFIVELIVESEYLCYDTISAPVEVLPAPKALFTVEDVAGCAPFEVTINNLSEGVDTYNWDFDDGTAISNQDDPVITRIYDNLTDDPVTHTIHLLAENVDGCTSEYSIEITVYPIVNAEFDPVDDGCHPHTVLFSNTSHNAIIYEWDFGDGITSTQENPEHTYHNFSHTDNVQFTATLYAESEFGCYDIFEQEDITVLATPLADFSVLNSPGCAPHEIHVVNESIGADSYEWDFGDNSNPATSNAEHPGPIEYTLPPGDDPGISTITLDVLHANGCPHQFQLDVTIYPEIEAAASANVDVGCAPFTVQFENSSSFNATSFHWDFGDGNISSQAEPEYTFHNTTGGDIVYVVEMVAYSDFGCTDTTLVTITVHPQVTAGFDFSPAYACNPHEVEFVNTSVSGSTMTYDWAFGDLNTSVEENPANLYEHDEETLQVYDIVLTVTADVGGCVDVATDQITIYPKVFADFLPIPVSGCSPLEVFFQNDSERAENYQWHFGHGDASSAEDEPTHTFVNTDYENSVFFDVTLIAESEYLCYDTIVLPDAVEVYSSIKAAFTVEESSGCTPFTVTVNNNSIGVDTYEWDFGDGTNSNTDENSFTHTYINNTDESEEFIITLTATNDDGCDSVFSRVITVYPAVNAGFTVDEDSGCNPHDVVFTNTTGDLVTFDIFYEWDFGDGSTSTLENPGHTYLNLDHFIEAVFRASLFAQSEYGCWDLYEPVDRDITVFPLPLASFWVENDDPCMPQVIIHNASLGSTEFTLDLGDGTIIPGDDFSVFPYVHDYTVEPDMVVRVFDIELTVFNDDDCVDVSTQQVTIYPDVIAGFSMSGDTGCHPFTVDFTNESVGASGYIEYEWDFGDGNISREENPQHTFQNHSQTVDETFTVILTAYYEDACYDTFQRDVTVQASPLADFTVPNSPGCAPHDIEVVNNSVGATTFAWDFGDGSAVDNSEHPDPHPYTQPAGEGPGIFMITLNVDNDDCSHQYQQDVTIYPEIDAMFTMNEEGCHPLTVQFDNETVGGDSFTWDFGEGNQSQELNPQHIFYNYSNTDIVTRTVTLFAESDYGCQAQYNDDVTVFPLPKSRFTLSEATGCSPFSPDILNTSVGNDLTYEWDFGDGNVSDQEEPVNTWTNLTDGLVEYRIALTVINEFGCRNTSYETITVYPEVTADYTTEDDLLAGCSPFEVKFVNQSHLGKIYFWDFDDGNTSTSANPFNTFVNEGTEIEDFNVSLEATSVYGCKDTLVRVISTYPSPIADFIASPARQSYPDATVTITNRTNPGDWTFEWDFGDGSEVYVTDDPAPFDYTYVWVGDDMTTKIYTITLTAYNELCTGVKQQQVTITSPAPVADFGPTTQGCEPFQVQFFNNSLYSHQYQWHFGDGAISMDVNPRHTFYNPGIYDVMLIAIGDGGRDTTYRQITVYENPVADFELVSNYIMIPREHLQAINLSELASYYFWEFGDGGTSTEFEPQYYYQVPGIYDISLTVYTDTDPQCEDMKVLESGLRVDESCNVVFPNAFQPSKAGPTGGAYDPNHPTLEVFYPLHEGVDKYVLEIFNRWGELVFKSTDPNIGWDGYHRGRLARMDVYVWKVTAICTNGRVINKSGDVTLIQ